MRRWLLIALACEPLACGEPASAPEAGDETTATTAGSELPPGSDDSTGAGSAPPGWLCPDDQTAPYFVLGWDYKDGWFDLEPDGPVTIIIGGQGAWMVPIGVRGDGFCVPEDPFDYDNEPILDIRITAEGIDGPIASVHDFPVSFVPVDDEGFGYTFIPMILLDELAVEELEGVRTSIRAELVLRDGTTLQYALDGELTVSE